LWGEKPSPDRCIYTWTGAYTHRQVYMPVDRRTYTEERRKRSRWVRTSAAKAKRREGINGTSLVSLHF
jgi:hypothetical protein